MKKWYGLHNLENVSIVEINYDNNEKSLFTNNGKTWIEEHWDRKGIWEFESVVDINNVLSAMNDYDVKNVRFN